MDFNLLFQDQEVDAVSLLQLQQQQQSLQEDHQQQQQAMTVDQNVTTDTSIGFQSPDSFSGQPLFQQQQILHQQQAGQAESRLPYPYYAVDQGNLTQNPGRHSILRQHQQAGMLSEASSCEIEYPVFTELMPAPTCQRDVATDQSIKS